MAEKVVIQKKDNVTEIFLDGSEISNVISYELSEDCSGAKIKLEVYITGEIEVQLK